MGVNSDASVKRLKGENRPIHNQDIRREVLKSIKYVDKVIIFDENTPQRLIESVSPDILVKGADWAGNVVGTEYVEKRGGKVILMPLEEGFSSTNIIKNMSKFFVCDNIGLGDTGSSINKAFLNSKR